MPYCRNSVLNVEVLVDAFFVIENCSRRFVCSSAGDRGMRRVCCCWQSHRRDHHNFDIPRPNYPPLARPGHHQPHTSRVCKSAARGSEGWDAPRPRGSGDGGEADHPQPRWWSNSIGLNGTCEIYLISFGYIKYYTYTYILAFELRLQV